MVGSSAMRARLLPGVGIQVPPNLADWWPQLVARGRDRSRRSVGQRRSHLARASVPESRTRCASACTTDGVALTERLCVYPQYIDQEWVAQGVLDVIRQRYWSFIPRRSRAARARTDAPRPIRPDLVAGAIERGRAGAALSADELTALFAETRPAGDRRAACGGRRAARRARGGDRDVRRQPQHQRLEHLHRRLRVLRLRPGQALARGLRARRGRVPPPRRRGRRVRRDRDLHAVRDPSRLGARGLPALAARRARTRRRRCTCTPTARWRSRTCATSRGLPPDEVFARLRDAGLGSTPGTAAEVLHDGVRERISPNKLPVARWVEIIEASHRAGLRSTSTVMFGHIEEPWELAEHMRVSASCRSAPAGSPSSCRCRSSRSTRCSGARTGSRRSPARRTSSTPPCSASRSDARSRTSRRAG